MKIKVGVIFGGETVEHEVSIISALQAINNIDKEKYEVDLQLYKNRGPLLHEIPKEINLLPEAFKYSGRIGGRCGLWSIGKR